MKSWVADRSAFLMTLSDLERRDASSQIFRRISLIALVSFDLERPNSAGKHMWGRTYFQGPDTPIVTARGRYLQRPQFWGSLSFMHASFDAELPNLTWQHVWGVVLGGVTPTPEGRGHSALDFGVSFLFMGTPFVTVLPNFDQIGMVTQIGRGVFRRSATPLRLYKCVARFVSDS